MGKYEYTLKLHKLLQFSPSQKYSWRLHITEKKLIICKAVAQCSHSYRTHATNHPFYYENQFYCHFSWYFVQSRKTWCNPSDVLSKIETARIATFHFEQLPHHHGWSVWNSFLICVLKRYFYYLYTVETFSYLFWQLSIGCNSFPKPRNMA